MPHSDVGSEGRLQKRLAFRGGVVNGGLGGGKVPFGGVELLLRWPSAEESVYGKVGLSSGHSAFRRRDGFVGLVQELVVWCERCFGFGEFLPCVIEPRRFTGLADVDVTEGVVDLV